jgi:translation initiation factor IF-2
MTDENGLPTKSAGPSIPVEILGLPEAPNAGDEFMVVDDERKAREVAEFRANQRASRQVDSSTKHEVWKIFLPIWAKRSGQAVNVVLKTDVRGSLEAITQALTDLSTEDVRLYCEFGRRCDY